MPSSSLLLTSTITVHYAKKHRRDDRNDEWNHEKVYDRLQLLLPVVRSHHDRFILLRVVTWKHCALEAVQIGEVFALDRRWVTAAFYVHQKDRFLRSLDIGQIEQLRGRRVERERKVQIVDKRHIDMGTLEHIRGAALAARAPRAVEQAGHVFAPRRDAHRRSLDKVADQRRDRRVDIERNEKQYRRPGGHRQERQAGRCVEAGIFAQCPLRCGTTLRLFGRGKL